MKFVVRQITGEESVRMTPKIHTLFTQNFDADELTLPPLSMVSEYVTHVVLDDYGDLVGASRIRQHPQHKFYYGCYIATKQKGCGVGTMLFTAVRDYILGQSATLLIEVDAQSTGGTSRIRFYNRLGGVPLSYVMYAPDFSGKSTKLRPYQLWGWGIDKVTPMKLLEYVEGLITYFWEIPLSEVTTHYHHTSNQ